MTSTLPAAKQLKIEFLGLPGSGKTTLAKATAEFLSVPRIIQRNSRRDLALQHPLAFLVEVLLQSLRIKSWQNRQIARELYLRSAQQVHHGGAVIFEEGVLFEVWRRVVLERISDEPWQELIVQNSSDLVVFVDASDEVIQARLAARNNPVDLAYELAAQSISSDVWSRSRMAMAAVLAEVEKHKVVLRVRSDHDDARIIAGYLVDEIQRSDIWLS